MARSDIWLIANDHLKILSPQRVHRERRKFQLLGLWYQFLLTIGDISLVLCTHSIALLRLARAETHTLHPRLFLLDLVTKNAHRKVAHCPRYTDNFVICIAGAGSRPEQEILPPHTSKLPFPYLIVIAGARVEAFITLPDPDAARGTNPHTTIN
ncbi:hypothetical protein EV421DRAFT_1744093 [Armillaria borealis]|uniref:Uncharacterized protein n=1 Tax=Armillaria borealis TaxID=47425 RepID=A0AA39IV27_9AGAR|nr:hypothetical protein EV421DRAFT_1744093 [Armillaria borealis]